MKIFNSIHIPKPGKWLCECDFCEHDRKKVMKKVEEAYRMGFDAWVDKYSKEF